MPLEPLDGKIATSSGESQWITSDESRTEVQGLRHTVDAAIAQIVANPQELTQMTFADLMRSAADAGLIYNVKNFLTYRDARNQTSHTYDEETAEDVSKAAGAFYKDAIALLNELRKRNS